MNVLSFKKKKDRAQRYYEMWAQNDNGQLRLIGTGKFSKASLAGERKKNPGRIYVEHKGTLRMYWRLAVSKAFSHG